MVKVQIHVLRHAVACCSMLRHASKPPPIVLQNPVLRHAAACLSRRCLDRELCWIEVQRGEYGYEEDSSCWRRPFAANLSSSFPSSFHSCKSSNVPMKSESTKTRGNVWRPDCLLILSFMDFFCATSISVYGIPRMSNRFLVRRMSAWDRKGADSVEKKYYWVAILFKTYLISHWLQILQSHIWLLFTLSWPPLHRRWLNLNFGKFARICVQTKISDKIHQPDITLQIRYCCSLEPQNLGPKITVGVQWLIALTYTVCEEACWTLACYQKHVNN